MALQCSGRDDSSGMARQKRPGNQCVRYFERSETLLLGMEGSRGLLMAWLCVPRSREIGACVPTTMVPPVRAHSRCSLDIHRQAMDRSEQFINNGLLSAVCRRVDRHRDKARLQGG